MAPYVPTHLKTATADSISSYSDQRVHPGPIRDFAARDFATEALEEAGDGRNYCCWEFLKLDNEDRDDEDAGAEYASLTLAMMGFVLAYYALRDYQQRRRPE